MKPISNSRLINRLMANKLIQNLFNYLSYSHLNSWFCPPYYLVFISIDNFISYKVQLFVSCSILFFSNINCFINYSIQFFVNCNVLFFISINSFVSCNIQYLTFLFILNHTIKFINNPKDLLDYLVSSRLSRFFYLYRASQIFYYIT